MASDNNRVCIACGEVVMEGTPGFLPDSECAGCEQPLHPFAPCASYPPIVCQPNEHSVGMCPPCAGGHKPEVKPGKASYWHGPPHNCLCYEFHDNETGVELCPGCIPSVDD